MSYSLRILSLRQSRGGSEISFGLYATLDWLQRAENEWQFLGYDDSLNHTPQEQWLVKYAKKRPFALRTNDLATLYMCAREGLGLALLPHFLGTQDDRLVLVHGLDYPRPRKIWLVLHPDVRKSPRVRAVADAIAQIVEQQNTLLLGISEHII